MGVILKVKQLFDKEKIDAQFIKDHFSGKYWTSCYLFIKENYDRNLEDISDQQRAWAGKIVDDLVEYKIEVLKPWNEGK